MRWIEMFCYGFVLTVIVLIARGAIKAFIDFQHGRHHEKQKGQ